MKKLNCEITISRPTTNFRENNFLRIEIRETISGLRFLEAEATLEDFMSALTGHCSQPLKVELRDTEPLGKRRISEPRKKVCPMKGHRDPAVFSDWLRDHAQEDGWELDTYLGRKGAVETTNEGTVLRYSVHKYVDAKPVMEEAK